MPQFSLHFIDANNGWAAGDLGTIIRTSDGGETWSTITTPNTTIIGTIWFTNLNKGWAAQMNGNILYSNDGGSNWISDTSLGVEAIWSCFFTSQDTGFLAGNDGKMYKTTNGGSLSINENKKSLKDDISISVFPIPIQNDAEIDIYLPSKSICSVNLTDNNGVKISNLLSEVKEKGKHHLHFNFTNIPNGIYFCEFQTENYKMSRKIVISH